MTLQELQQAVATLLTQLPAQTPVAPACNVAATVSLAVIGIDGEQKVCVLEAAQ